MNKQSAHRNPAYRSFLRLALLALLAPTLASAVEIRAGVPKEDWQLMVEPSFLRAPAGRPFPNSKKTLQVPAIPVDGEPRRLRTEEFRALQVEWEAFAAQAARNANAILHAVEPEFARNSAGVVTHAVFRSENPFTASLIFASEFVGQFEKIFGPEILVAVPNRNTVYVFPKLAGPHKEFGMRILFDYRNSAYPCSLELFQVSAEGIRAVGSYDSGE